jgi:Domain of unknown function (DUF1905)
MSPAKAAPAVRFEATLYAIDGHAIRRLPEKAGNQMPSRGQVPVQAAVNGHACQTVAGPDGESGHWVRIGAKQQRAAALRAGDTAEVGLVPSGTGRNQRCHASFRPRSLRRRTGSRSCGRPSRQWRAGSRFGG